MAETWLQKFCGDIAVRRTTFGGDTFASSDRLYDKTRYGTIWLVGLYAPIIGPSEEEVMIGKLPFRVVDNVGENNARRILQ